MVLELNVVQYVFWVVCVYTSADCSQSFALLYSISLQMFQQLRQVHVATVTMVTYVDTWSYAATTVEALDVDITLIFPL